MINYSLLEIKRAIFHKVMAKRNDQEPFVEESQELITLTPQIIDIFRKRMTDAFGQVGKAFELIIIDIEDGSTFSIIHGMRQIDDSSFIEKSIELANKLADSQNKIIIPHGFFVLLDCINPLDNMPVYVLMKAEPHDALEINNNTARALQNIILSPTQKMYKAACFQQISTEGGYRGYKTYLFDEQFASRARLADYFYNKFAGLSVKENDKVLTKIFFFRMIEAIKDYYKENYNKRNDAEYMLNAVMRNQNTTLNPRSIINDIIDYIDRDYFLRRVLIEEMPASFRKNISLIDTKLMNRSVSISDNIRLFAPHNMFENTSFVIDRESDNDYVIVKIAKNRV